MTATFQDIMAALTGAAAPAEGAGPAAGALPPSSPPTPPPGFATAPQAAPPPPPFTTAPWPVTDAAAEAIDDVAEERAEEVAAVAEEERAARLRARARRLELEREIRRVDPWWHEQSRANSLRQNARRAARREAKRAGITDPAEIERLADEAAEKIAKPAATAPRGASPSLDVSSATPLPDDLRREVDRKRSLLASRSIDAVMIDEGPTAAEIVVDLAKRADSDATRFRAASYVVDRASVAGKALDLGDLAVEIAGMSASRAVDAVALAVLQGRISRDDGEFAMKLCEARIAALQIDDLLGRIDTLQGRIAELAAKSAAPARE